MKRTVNLCSGISAVILTDFGIGLIHDEVIFSLFYLDARGFEKLRE